MKYGDTLRQRSIPEWAHYNIDYDYLKDLIKDQTTPGSGKALSIPGQGDAIERAFGDTFFKVLREQHTRINCFVKSKSGEIESRLDFIGKRLAQLRAKRSDAAPGARLPAKTVEQYAKIDADVTKAGEEIRSLARFRTAQRTGFHKILKKYKRWTRDTELERRFNDEICSNPDSFFQLDLGHLLDQYIDVLGAVRAPLDSGPLSHTNPSHTSSSQLSKAIEDGSDIDYDIALSTTPLGSHGSTAIYWVHVDHIVEVQVLLLQHMRLHIAKQNGSTKSSPYATPSRRKSSSTVDNYLGNEDDVGMIVLDQLEAFVLRQNASTVGSSEEAAGKTRVLAAGNVRWAGSGEAAVIIRASEDPNDIRTTKLKRKFVDAFLDTTSPFNEGRDRALSSQHSESKKASKDPVRQYLSDKKEIKPIAGVRSKRTRFVGLANSPAGGSWATLDRDVLMKDSFQESLRSTDDLSEARHKAIPFAHAVLEIRREGGQSAALIQQLDNSHLVQRVHGYSLETHAVWACCKPETMSPPIWLSLVEQDIRKLPTPTRRRRRKAGSTTDSQAHTSPPQTSTSATSVTDGQSTPFASRHEDTPATSASEILEAPLQAFRKKRRRPFAEYPPPIQPEAPQKQGYWNEYDNPESEDEGYYIYVDPNAPVTFPGQEFFESCVKKTKELLGLSKPSGEQSPLLSTPDYVSSDDETEAADGFVPGGARNYGAIPQGQNTHEPEGYFSSLFQSLRNPQRDAQALSSIHRQSELQRRSLLTEIHIRQHQREMAKLQTYASCLVAGTVLDIVLGVLATTSRRKLRGEVDIAIILGVICNLLLLLTAVISMKTRHDRLGWLHLGVVYIVVVGLVVVDVLLFQWALNL